MFKKKHLKISRKKLESKSVILSDLTAWHPKTGEIGAVFLKDEKRELCYKK